MDPTVLAALIGAAATFTTAYIGRKSVASKEKENTQLKKEWDIYKGAISSVDSYLNIDYGIKITSPVGGDQVNDYFDVTGTYEIMPPTGTLRLFTVHQDKTDYGERYWPQTEVKDFNSSKKVWHARVNIGDPTPGLRWSVVAAIVGQPTIVIWNYYYKVGPKVGWWDFEGWPSDSKICSRVDNLRRI